MRRMCDHMAGRRDGIILKETAAVILIVLMLIPVCVVCISALSASFRFHEEIQDRIALQQLRRMMLLAYDAETAGDHVAFEYQGEKRELRFVNRWLLVQPGTLIFLSDVDGGHFFEKDGGIYVVYERNGQETECILAQE